MLKRVVKTLFEGALGLGALYLVAKLSFNAGKEFANTSQEYLQMKEQVLTNNPDKAKEEPNKKESWFARNTRKFFGFENPEISIKIKNNKVERSESK